MEIDVRLTRDAVPVLLHDSTLERLWGHERPLSALSSDEVRGLTEDGVPTLADALETCRDARVMIDLPGADARAVRTVVGAVRDCDAEDRVYYCAGAETMLKVRAASPRPRSRSPGPRWPRPARPSSRPSRPAGSTTASRW